MSRLDIVIFGATGYTGQCGAEELVRISQKDPNLTWGIAGRSQDKLQKLLQKLKDKTGEDQSKVRIITADVDDENSLKAMTSQAKVIANCCGPFRHYGEQVVRACIATKTHHVDISGEPQYMESVQLKYHKEAEEAGVYIVSACGFDSIPNDLGVVFLEQNFDGTLNSVESRITSVVDPKYQKLFTPVVNYGTWASLVNGLSTWDELVQLRKQLYKEKMPTFKPTLKNRFIFHKDGEHWFVPFLGADKSIVYRSQRFFYEKENKRPVQFRPYIGFSSIVTAVATIFALGFIFLMSKTAFTRKLLLDYPRIFSFGFVSHDGPSEELRKNAVTAVYLRGVGWDKNVDVTTAKPEKRMLAKVSFVDAGYGATVIALIHSGLTIVKENDKIPGKGGVLTPGVAFANTSLVKTLNENNFKFEIVKE